MKKCSWCGKEFPDDAVICDVDKTPFEQPKESAPPAPPAPPQREYDFPPLSETDKAKDFVTLVTCGTLPEADLVVSRLRADGLASYKLPEQLHVVDALPTTASGKVQKHELVRQVTAAGASGSGGGAGRSAGPVGA